MKTFVLIGGKDAGLSADFSFEQKIMNKLNRKNPNILYVQIAQTSALLNKLEQFKQGFRDFPCNIDSLTSVSDLKLKEKLEWADVIYIAGGRASKLVHEIKGTFFEAFLRKDESRIWMGISAGAILFSKAGMGDEFVYADRNYNYGYQMVDGLGILSITCCPHYNHNGLECYNQIVSSYDCDGYALEDNTALLFQDYFSVIKYQKNRSIYCFSKEKNYQMIPIYEEV